MALRFCPHCGKPVESTGKFCPHCGKPIPALPEDAQSNNPTQNFPHPQPYGTPNPNGQPVQPGYQAPPYGQTHQPNQQAGQQTYGQAQQPYQQSNQAPYGQPYNPYQPVPPAQPPKKKSHTLLIVLLVIAGLIVGLFALLFFLGSSEDEDEEKTKEEISVADTSDEDGEAAAGGITSDDNAGSGDSEDTENDAADTAVTADDDSASHAAVSGETWTVLIYMCGSDLESDYGYATMNLEEALTATTSPAVNVLVETGGSERWDADYVNPDALDRFVMEEGKWTLVDEEARASMGSPYTLSEFITWGEQEYPADHYMLILWDHGDGPALGVCADTGYESEGLYVDFLTLPDLDDALNEAGVHFDMIGFDACLMASLETAATLSPYADFMIASEESEPASGWDYETILSALAEDPGISMYDFGAGVCNSFMDRCEYYDVAETSTMSVIDLNQVPKLCEKFDELSRAFNMASSDVASLAAINNSAHMAEKYAFQYGDMNLIDLGDFIAGLDDSFTESAYGLQSALSDAVVYKRAGDARANSNGLSIYYPLDPSDEDYPFYIDSVEQSQYTQFVSILTDNYDESDYPDDWAVDPASEEDAEPITYEVDTDGENLFLTITSGEDQLSLITARVAMHDEEYDMWFSLGVDTLFGYDEENDRFYDDFYGSWASIQGEPVCLNLVETTDDYLLYYIPVLWNDEEAIIIGQYHFDTEDYSILGVSPYDLENGEENVQDIQPLTSGDTVQFVYESVTDDDTFGELYTYYDPITWDDTCVLEDTLLDDSMEYGLGFELTDAFGNVEDTDTYSVTFDFSDVE